MHSNTNTQSECKVLWSEGINQRKPEKASSFCNLRHDQIQPNLGQIQIQFLSTSGIGCGAPLVASLFYVDELFR